MVMVGAAIEDSQCWGLGLIYRLECRILRKGILRSFVVGVFFHERIRVLLEGRYSRLWLSYRIAAYLRRLVLKWQKEPCQRFKI